MRCVTMRSGLLFIGFEGIFHYCRDHKENTNYTERASRLSIQFLSIWISFCMTFNLVAPRSHSISISARSTQISFTFLCVVLWVNRALHTFSLSRTPKYRAGMKTFFFLEWRKLNHKETAVVVTSLWFVGIQFSSGISLRPLGGDVTKCLTYNWHKIRASIMIFHAARALDDASCTCIFWRCISFIRRAAVVCL